MHLLTAKILSLTAIAIVSMIFGMLPCYLVRWFNTRGVLRTPRVRVFISAVICFSGGTLLGVAFLHLMPDMREKMQSLGWEGHGQSLPVSDIVTCGGFFFVYIFDELMHMFIEWYSTRAERQANVIHAESVLSVSPPILVNQEEKDILVAPSGSGSPMEGSPTLAMSTVETPGSGMRSPTLQNQSPTPHSPNADPCLTTAPMHHELHMHYSGASVGASRNRMEPRPLGYHEHEHDPHSSSHPIESPAAVPPLTGLITIVALSFHDIFEGLAIGVERNVQDVAFLYLSIAAHKYAIAFCIGMDLVLSRTRTVHLFLYMLTYSIVSPIGIIVGIMFQDVQDGLISIDTPVSETAGDGDAAGAGGRHTHLRGVLRSAAARGQRHARQGGVQRALRAHGIHDHARIQGLAWPLPPLGAACPPSPAPPPELRAAPERRVREARLQRSCRGHPARERLHSISPDVNSCCLLRRLKWTLLVNHTNPVSPKYCNPNYAAQNEIFTVLFSKIGHYYIDVLLL